MRTEAGRNDPRWYKDAIFYEVRIGAFHDSDGDGVGDFRGLTEKLDYLQDLGVTTLWLLPFYPSPMRDDGYDIADYTGIHPDSGTLEDFKAFLAEAHRRDLRVVTELVLNHTSDQHPWFQRARRAPKGSPERDFYVWSDTTDLYADARIIFKDFEPSNWAWDPVAKAYFWHRFYSHQPDLNFDNPAVRAAMLEVLDYWFDLGVDGLRLDAVPYLFEREGTSCENLAETHAFLKELRRHVDAKYPCRMLLAEANQWPEDSAAYFGDGDECQMAFHFPIMPRLFMAVRTEDRFPILDILDQTPAIHESCQWALFLRNHDELTLEMVTEEERDYMYRVYASDPRARINLGIRRRLAPLLGNQRRKIELLNLLLFSLPGTPVLYYGDEIGMGDNIYLGDRNGVRTPMQWSADRNAGFSRGNAQRLYLPIVIDPEYHYEAVNVDVQQGNPQSLLWWMKRLIAQRKRHPALSRGGIEFLEPRNGKVLAFLRTHVDERILVVANLSRFTQYVELDLRARAGDVPVELFGQTRFPPIGELPYLLTLGPHAVYWFVLERAPAATEVDTTGAADEEPLAVLTSPSGLQGLFSGDRDRAIERALPRILATRRWFAGKARKIRSTSVDDVVPIGTSALFALVRVEYTEGESETYSVPLAAIPVGIPKGSGESVAPRGAVARLRDQGTSQEWWIVDAPGDAAFADALLVAIGDARWLAGRSGGIQASKGAAFTLPRRARDRASELMSAEQSNSSIAYGGKYVLKLLRRLHPGLNPDLEIGRFLTERARFPHSPASAGALEYRRGKDEPITLGIVQEMVHVETDAWRYSLEALGRYLERALARSNDGAAPLPLPAQEPPAPDLAMPPAVREMLGTYPPWARLLAQRTAEMHRALASDGSDPAFAPEPFSGMYQRSIYQSMRSQARRSLDLLRERLESLPDDARGMGEELIDRQDQLVGSFRDILDRPLSCVRIRCHGDFHLGQALWTGKDFAVIDFEGEPARPLSERRIKRSPLRDVAGMLRSFDYASQVALRSHAQREHVDAAAGQQAARFWTEWVSAMYVSAYLQHVPGAAFVPAGAGDLRVLLRLFVLDKLTYELTYELSSRPDWADIPIRALLSHLHRS